MCDTRQCLQCLRVLPFQLFTLQQWRLAKTNSQCRTCEATFLLSQGSVRRLHKRKWEELTRVQPHDQHYAHEHKQEDVEEGGPHRTAAAVSTRGPQRRGGTGRRQRVEGHDRPDSERSGGKQESKAWEEEEDEEEGDEEEVEEEEEEEEEGDVEVVEGVRLGHVWKARSDVVAPTSAPSLLASSGAAADAQVKKRRRRRRRGQAERSDDDGEEEEDEAARRRRRRRRRLAAAAEAEAAEVAARAADGAADSSRLSSAAEQADAAVNADDAPVRRRRRKHRKSKRELAEEERQRRLQALCMSAQDNPYSRVQQLLPAPQSTSRSGRAPLLQSALSAPLPLNPDLLSLVRDSFGLTLAKDFDPLLALHSSSLNPVYSRYMQSTGTLRNGKVYVAVSGVSPSDDMPPSDSDEEFAIRRTRRTGRRKEDWQPMLGLFAGVDFHEGDVVTCYGGALVNADSARRRPKTTWTHIRRIRDSQYVKDGRLFSALFDRRQVDMWEQFQMKPHKRKRVPPACQPEHIVKALSTEGHEDEVRVGLLLLDADARDSGGRELEELDRVELLTEVMRQIGLSTAIIDGDAMREAGDKEAAALMQGRQCLVVNLPSATFSSSSPNPYAGSSSSSSPSPLHAGPATPISIAPLFPFPLQELHLPAATLHPLPDTRLTILMELVQNLHKKAKQRLHDACQDVHTSIGQGGLGFMANTGARNELNVRVVELNPRKDGLLPNEVFYVCTRPIRKHDEILAPYNNNETRRKHTRRKQQSAAAAQRDRADDDAENDEGEQGEADERPEAADRGDGEDAALASPTAEDASPSPPPRPVKLSKQQREKIKRVAYMESKRRERALLKLKQAQEAEREQQQEQEGEQAEEAEEGDRGEEDADMDEGEEEEAMVVTHPCLPRLPPPFSPVDASMDEGEVASSSASLPAAAALDGPLLSADCLPLLRFHSTSPCPSPLACISPSRSPSSSSPSSTPSEGAFASPSPPHRPPSPSAVAASSSSLSLSELQAKQAMEVLKVKLEAVDSSGVDAAAVAEEDNGGGFSVISRCDSPWIPPEILPQRTRARSRQPQAAYSAHNASVLILPFSAQKGRRGKLPA